MREAGNLVGTFMELDPKTLPFALSPKIAESRLNGRTLD